ncbi:MAG: DNA primase [bacterium]
MGRIPETVIDEVIRRTDVVQVISGYVTLKKAGANYKGLCPFHNEKTPSFNVHPAKGIYKCFGCGAGGSALNFLMEIEGWSFPETVRHLAEKHGIEIPEEDDEEREEAAKKRDAKKLYFRVMELARDYFETQLWSAAGRAAQIYLSERGISEQTARSFRMGYAPDGWQNVLDHLEKNGIQGRLVERAGLAMPRKGQSGYYDRFRHRIMFPVQDIWGNTLAFSGRVFAGEDDGPKYINSPETSFYTKGHHLFGLSVAKQAIQQSGYAVLVEGNFDVVALHAQGVSMAVAPLGTALTNDQTRLLARYCREAVVAFDGDSAGEEATLKAMPALDAVGIEARVVRFTDGDDPDSYVRRHGRDGFQKFMDSGKPIISWAIDRALVPAEGPVVEKKLHALESVAEVLSGVSNALAWEHYAQEVSRRLEIEPELLREYLQRPTVHAQRVREAVSVAAAPVELPPAEFGLLAVLLDHPAWLKGFVGESYDQLLESSSSPAFCAAPESMRAEELMWRCSSNTSPTPRSA